MVEVSESSDASGAVSFRCLKAVSRKIYVLGGVQGLKDVIARISEIKKECRRPLELWDGESRDMSLKVDMQGAGLELELEIAPPPG